MVLLMLSDYIQILDIVNNFFPGKLIFSHIKCDILAPGLNVQGNDNIMESKGSVFFFTLSFY